MIYVLLKIENVTKKIQNKSIIDNASFSVEMKEVVALVGPNGAGKTTLLKLVAGLLKPDKGKIMIDGKDNIEEKKSMLKNVSFLQDSTVLYVDISGLDHLYFIANTYEKSKSDIKEAIQRLGMEGYIHSKVRTYSLGMKQNLLLAIAIIKKPKLLLFDEPLNGLDPSGINMFRDILEELRLNGTSTVFSSHNLSEIDKVADKLVFINKGVVVNEENVSNKNSLNVSSYLLEVDNIKEVEILLKNENIKYSKGERSNQILIELHKGELNNILHKLIHTNIKIKDIKKVEQYSEAIYNRIYGG